MRAECCVNSAVGDNPAGDGWRARLQLTFAARADRTFLASQQHIGPLLVQRPFHPEGFPCHAYILHPPGGIVGGDELRLDVQVSDGGHALLTTPAATKFYRSDERLARQAQHLRVTNGVLEWLPQETIIYAGARVTSETCIRLDAGSKFIGWELPCLGLPARNEPFDNGELHMNLELWCDERPLLIDRMRLNGDSPARKALWGLAGHEAIGTLLAYPTDGHCVELAREVSAADGVESAVTLVDGVLVCRALAAQAEPVKRLFIDIWQRLRPQLLDRPAVLPRIWAT
jgi:urease accessory protein